MTCLPMVIYTIYTVYQQIMYIIPVSVRIMRDKVALYILSGGFKI